MVDLKKSIKLLKVGLVNGYGKNHGGHVQTSAVWKLLHHRVKYILRGPVS